MKNHFTNREALAFANHLSEEDLPLWKTLTLPPCSGK